MFVPELIDLVGVRIVERLSVFACLADVFAEDGEVVLELVLALPGWESSASRVRGRSSSPASQGCVLMLNGES